MDLDQILGSIAADADPDLLVGFGTADDAGVYRLDPERALVTTADFITPVVDDPRAFGAVAAANSLSDVYAMGGTPLVAINLTGYPPAQVPTAVLGAILQGAAEKCREAGCAVVGGHTVRDDEIKFGLAVTGIVHPDRVMRNSTARPGDLLVLTKPLGTGALVAAGRAGKLPPASGDALLRTMTTLNRGGRLLHGLGATAATDVTGFGLSGHALEMARGADVTFRIACGRLPLLPDAVRLCGEGFTCGGTRSNAAFIAATAGFDPALGEDWRGLLNDPQTSGGLLIAVPPDRSARLVEALLDDGALCAEIVGEVAPRAQDAPHLLFTP